MLWTARPAHLAQMALAAAAEITGVDVDSLRLVHACPRCGSHSHGRPIVLGGPTVHVSLGRCVDRGVAALGLDGPLGVDVEPLTSTARPATDRTARWTRVEALLKLTGAGLTVESDAVDTIEIAGVHRIRRWPAGSPRPEALALDLDAGPDHVAAVALPDRGAGPTVVSRWAGSEV